MSTSLQAIASNLWSDEPQPHLLGARDASGKILFPIPEGESAEDIEIIKLSRSGTLWSYTQQEFRPKPPYDGPEDFKPFIVGFVELPNEIIVESHIVETSLDQLQLGMRMELIITAFDDTRSMFAFRPEK